MREGGELEGGQCVCGKSHFENSVGVSVYKGTEDVRWLYVGCRCVACGLMGCYGEWKNESVANREFVFRD